MRRWLFEQSLTLFFLAIFLLSLVGQSVAGLVAYNEEQRSHGDPTISYGRYLVSPDFGGNVMENWQSEFLQFTLIILVTVWLVQRGSTESKKVEEAGPESDADARVGEHAPRDAPAWAKVRGWRRRVYENSLGLAMLAIFLATWFAQSLNGWRMFDEEQAAHGQATISWIAYVANADFWNRTLQNWQSEFLAVATMTAFSIYLRQRGSPESKPVGAPHSDTGSSG
jgi:uncharacterized protein DUF6766